MQRERSDANFLKAIVAVRDVITRTALGKDQIPLPLRRQFSDQATSFYESLLQDDSADGSLQYDTAVGYRTIGMLHTSWDEFLQAEKSYRRAIEILEHLTTAEPSVQHYQHQLGYAHLEFSRMLYRTGRFEEAQAIVDRGINLYEKLVADTPDSADYIAQLANFYIDPTKFGVPAEWQPGDDPHRAAFELLKMAASLPDKPPPPGLVHSADTIPHRQRDLAFALRDAGRLDEAGEMFQYAAGMFESLRDKDPGNTIYWHFLADTHREVGLVELGKQNLEQAEHELRRAVEIHEQRVAKFPDKSVNDAEWSYAYFDLARLLMKTGRMKEVMPLIARGVEVDPATNPQPVGVRVQIRLGDLLSETGEDDQALATYSEIIDANPDVSHAWVSRGWLYGKRQEWEKSEADFTKAIELQPEHWEGWSGRAFSHFHRQQWEPAIADFSKAIDFGRDVHTNPFHRGRAYIELAQWENAVEDFNRAIDLAPKDSWSYYCRAQAYAQSNRPELAIADLRQAIAKGFNDSHQWKYDSKLEPLRSSGEFQKLMAGLEEESR